MIGTPASHVHVHVGVVFHIMTENVQILINSSVFWSFWARLGDRVLGFGLGREAGFWVLVTPLKTRVRGRVLERNGEEQVGGAGGTVPLWRTQKVV